MAVSGRHQALAALSPGKKHGVNLTGGTVDHRAGLDARMKRQISLFWHKWNKDLMAVQIVAWSLN